MTHLDEGALLTLRDGGPLEAAEAAHLHLETCAQCREALDELRRNEGTISAALETLDTGFDVEDARRKVRERVALHTAAASGTPSILGRVLRGTSPLRRAAGLVLLAAAGAYALPGSPVRGWVDALVTPGPREAVETDARPAAPIPVPESSGIRVSVTAPVRVTLLGLAPGDEVTVLWVPGTEVAVFADSDSRFSSGASAVQATVSGGPVRVELPLDVRPLSLEVGGRLWIRSIDGGNEMYLEPVETTNRLQRFLVPEATGG